MTDSIRFQIRRGLTHEISGKILFEKTEGNQLIQIMKSEIFGNVLFINNVPQLSQFDQELYHKVQVKSLKSEIYNGEEVLILGGGDLGLVSQLVDENIKEVHVVDVSKTVPEITKSFFPELVESSNQTILHTQDCFEYLKEESKRTFRVVFADLSGTTVEEEKLFSGIYLGHIRRFLKKSGVFVTYIDNHLFYPELHERKHKALKEAFSFVKEKRLFIPIFGYEVPFVFCSAYDLNLNEVDESIKMRSHNLQAKTWKELYG